MMYTPHFKKIVRDAVKLYRKELNVEAFDIKIFYHSEEKEPISSSIGTAAMDMRVTRRYLQATLGIYPTAIDEWKRNGDESIREIIAHEIAHIETQHMYEMAIAIYKDEGETHDAWERLTTILGRFLYNAAERKRKP